MTRIDLFIDGEWTSGAAGRHLDIVSPATEAVIGQAAVAETSDLDRALAAPSSSAISLLKSDKEGSGI